MDKILSARVSDSTLRRIGFLARHLRTSKKAIIESAVEAYAQKVEEEHGVDVFTQTLGAWQREESAETTVHEVREVFRKSMSRHQQ